MKERLRYIGFFILGAISLLYVIFSRNFAEIHAQVPFLDFPVFVGEISLFACLVLSFFIFDFYSIKGWQWAAASLYFIAVILKALLGYGQWGPLAFRHAALFYYPVFILLGFIFYKKDFLSEPLKIFIVIFTLVLCLTRYFYEYWIFALWALAFILIRSFKYRVIKYFFYTGLLSVVFLGYKTFFLTSRTFVSGNIAAACFLIITLLLIAKVKVFYKTVVCGIIFMLLAVFFLKYSSLTAAKTIFDISGIINEYGAIEERIKVQTQYYVPMDLKQVKLFNPERPVSPKSSGYTRIRQSPPKSSGYTRIHQAPPKSLGHTQPRKEKPQLPLAASAGNKMLQEQTSVKPANIYNNAPVMQERNAGDASSNTLFRILMWRDMIFEFSRSRPIFGFSFGKPFRSVTLEILNWGNGDWQRDGWIEPHNSYINMFYRLGILGAAAVIFLIWQFFYLAKSFVERRSLTGILLCSILINWSVAANFLPILELPYNAVPFWALWGATLGYLHELKNKGQVSLPVE